MTSLRGLSSKGHPFWAMAEAYFDVRNKGLEVVSIDYSSKTVYTKHHQRYQSKCAAAIVTIAKVVIRILLAPVMLFLLPIYII